MCIRDRYKRIVISLHNLSRTPAANFGLSATQIALVNALQQKDAIIFQFANAYAAKNWCDAKNLVICYEDDEVVPVSYTHLDVYKRQMQTCRHTGKLCTGC